MPPNMLSAAMMPGRAKDETPVGKQKPAKPKKQGEGQKGNDGQQAGQTSKTGQQASGDGGKKDGSSNTQGGKQSQKGDNNKNSKTGEANSNSDQKNQNGQQQNPEQHDEQNERKTNDPSGGRGQPESENKNGSSDSQKSSSPSQIGSTVATIVKWLIYLALAIAAIYFAMKYWDTIKAGLARFIQDLKDMFNNLFGRKPKPESGPMGAEDLLKPRSIKPFSNYANPFRTGQEQNMGTIELIAYTYDALQAGRGERLPQTPRPDAYRIRPGNRPAGFGTRRRCPEHRPTLPAGGVFHFTAFHRIPQATQTSLDPHGIRRQLGIEGIVAFRSANERAAKEQASAEIR